MTDDTLTWLMAWYARQCDEEWEHSFGVTIETLDNPGWSVDIDLEGTAMEGVMFALAESKPHAPDGNPDERWHRCWVEHQKFSGVGGAHDLLTILDIFRAWVLKQGAG